MVPRFNTQETEGVIICGIFGYIGRSVDPATTFQLSNALFVKTERRGEHASGFWACEVGDGVIFYDKEPVKSSIYQYRTPWKDEFASAKTDLLLAHCRFSTLTAGNEKVNRNNHPHVSVDKRTALIHNGKIPEYSTLKSRYETLSDCDSEVILRMFETGFKYKDQTEFLDKEFPNLSIKHHQLMGLREIFSRIQHAAMAVAIGERGEDEIHQDRKLWLFRDEERPLHIIDMRATLGQIFFCSEPEIWQAACSITPEIKKYNPEQEPVIKFPAFEAWMLSYSPKTEEQKQILKWNYLYNSQTWKKFKDKYESKKMVPTEEWTAVFEEVKANKEEWEDSVTKEELTKAVFSTEWTNKRYKVIKTKFSTWESDKVKIPITNAEKTVTKVVSRLIDTEEIDKKFLTTEKIVNESRAVINANTTATSKSSVYTTQQDKNNNVGIDFENSEDDDDAIRLPKDFDTELETLSQTSLTEGIDMQKFDDLVVELRKIVDEIDTSVKNLHREKNLTIEDFSVITRSMEDAAAELKGSVLFIK